MVIITVNGDEVRLEKPLSIAELLIEQKVITPEYVTVQINDAFVEGGELDNVTVRDGDVVDFVYFMGGGR